MSSRVGRIHQRALFKALQQPAGYAVRGPLRVRWVPQSTAPFPLVGYAIGRKSGNAVRRNRLRRRLRAAVSKSGPYSGTYLISADAATNQLDFEELVMTVSSAMHSAAQRGSRP